MIFRRLTAVSCECGLFKLSKINVEKLVIHQNWILRYDNPVCNVEIFSSSFEAYQPSFLHDFKYEIGLHNKFSFNFIYKWYFTWNYFILQIKSKKLH